MGQYSFRQSSHINLQEARALRREVKSFAADFKNGGKIQIALNDSRVVIGAFSKGRSSSFKLNGILRGMMSRVIFGGIGLALIWIETGANPADYPSRFRELPPPLSMPPWLKKMFGKFPQRFGWEIFAGTAKLTAAHVALGIPMLTPVELANGLDAMEDWVEQKIRSGVVAWVWLAPPCGSPSFSSLSGR